MFVFAEPPLSLQGKWYLFESRIMLKVKINLPDVVTSRQRDSCYCHVQQHHEIFYRIGLHGKDLFSYVLGSSKAGLFSTFTL